MTKTIRTHIDLLEERTRLQNLLELQKQEIRNNLTGIKNDLKPVTLVFSFVGKLLTRKRNGPILRSSTKFLGDFILKRIVLARTGRLTRAFIPFIFKNYVSHALRNREPEILGKIATWLRQRKFKE